MDCDCCNHIEILVEVTSHVPHFPADQIPFLKLQKHKFAIPFVWDFSLLPQVRMTPLWVRKLL
jgi:hypothetical protein